MKLNHILLVSELSFFTIITTNKNQEHFEQCYIEIKYFLHHSIPGTRLEQKIFEVYNSIFGFLLKA